MNRIPLQIPLTVIIALFILGGLVACARPVELPFEEVLRASRSNYRGGRPYFIAATKAEMEIPGLAQNQLSRIIPSIDFDSQFFIAAFYGSTGDAGYSIEIRRITQRANMVTMQVYTQDKSALDVIGSAFCYVSVDKSAMPERGELTFVFVDMEGEELARMKHYIP